MSKTAISPHAVGVLNITNSLTFTKCTVAAGGVFIVGRICFINLRLATTENWSSQQKFMQGLPKPLNGNNTNSTGFRLTYQNLHMGCLLNANGDCALSSNSDTPVSGTAVLINAAYVIDGNEIMTEYVTGDEDIIENAITFSASAADANNDSIVTKNGKMVTVQLFCKATAAISSGTAIATLAQDAWPKKVVNTAGMIIDYTNNTTPAECLRIGTDGVITLRTKSLNVNDVFGFIVTYRKS